MLSGAGDAGLSKRHAYNDILKDFDRLVAYSDLDKLLDLLKMLSDDDYGGALVHMALDLISKHKPSLLSQVFSVKKNKGTHLKSEMDQLDKTYSKWNQLTEKYDFESMVRRRAKEIQKKDLNEIYGLNIPKYQTEIAKLFDVIKLTNSQAPDGLFLLTVPCRNVGSREVLLNVEIDGFSKKIGLETTQKRPDIDTNDIGANKDHNRHLHHLQTKAYQAVAASRCINDNIPAFHLRSNVFQVPEEALRQYKLMSNENLFNSAMDKDQRHFVNVMAYVTNIFKEYLWSCLLVCAEVQNPGLLMRDVFERSQGGKMYDYFFFINFSGFVSSASSIPIDFDAESTETLHLHKIDDNLKKGELYITRQAEIISTSVGRSIFCNECVAVQRVNMHRVREQLKRFKSGQPVGVAFTDAFSGVMYPQDVIELMDDPMLKQNQEKILGFDETLFESPNVKLVNMNNKKPALKKEDDDEEEGEEEGKARSKTNQISGGKMIINPNFFQFTAICNMYENIFWRIHEPLDYKGTGWMVMKPFITTALKLLNRNEQLFVKKGKFKMDASFYTDDQIPKDDNSLGTTLLREMSQSAPPLEPEFDEYVREKQIPYAIIFFRIIGCTNKLACKELSHQFSLHDTSRVKSILEQLPPSSKTEIVEFLRMVQQDSMIFMDTKAWGTFQKTKKVPTTDEKEQLRLMMHQTMNRYVKSTTNLELPIGKKWLLCMDLIVSLFSDSVKNVELDPFVREAKIVCKNMIGESIEPYAWEQETVCVQNSWPKRDQNLVNTIPRFNKLTGVFERFVHDASSTAGEKKLLVGNSKEEVMNLPNPQVVLKTMADSMDWVHHLMTKISSVLSFFTSSTDMTLYTRSRTWIRRDKDPGDAIPDITDVAFHANLAAFFKNKTELKYEAGLNDLKYEYVLKTLKYDDGTYYWQVAEDDDLITPQSNCYLESTTEENDMWAYTENIQDIDFRQTNPVFVLSENETRYYNALANTNASTSTYRSVGRWSWWVICPNFDNNGTVKIKQFKEEIFEKTNNLFYQCVLINEDVSCLPATNEGIPGTALYPYGSDMEFNREHFCWRGDHVYKLVDIWKESALRRTSTANIWSHKNFIMHHFRTRNSDEWIFIDTLALCMWSHFMWKRLLIKMLFVCAVKNILTFDASLWKSFKKEHEGEFSNEGSLESNGENEDDILQIIKTNQEFCKSKLPPGRVQDFLKYAKMEYSYRTVCQKKSDKMLPVRVYCPDKLDPTKEFILSPRIVSKKPLVIETTEIDISLGTPTRVRKIVPAEVKYALMYNVTNTSWCVADEKNKLRLHVAFATQSMPSFVYHTALDIARCFKGLSNNCSFAKVTGQDQINKVIKFGKQIDTSNVSTQYLGFYDYTLDDNGDLFVLQQDPIDALCPFDDRGVVWQGPEEWHGLMKKLHDEALIFKVQWENSKYSLQTEETSRHSGITENHTAIPIVSTNETPTLQPQIGTQGMFSRILEMFKNLNKDPTWMKHDRKRDSR